MKKIIELAECKTVDEANTKLKKGWELLTTYYNSQGIIYVMAWKVTVTADPIHTPKN